MTFNEKSAIHLIHLIQISGVWGYFRFHHVRTTFLTVKKKMLLRQNWNPERFADDCAFIVLLCRANRGKYVRAFEILPGQGWEKCDWPPTVTPYKQHVG